jgi:E3 ubiquitin-protein ligase makorin
LSFAVQKSEDKQCTICYENVINKENPGNRFGILLNCWHVFCLECIRKWRTSRQFENEIIRACPVCRIASDFVCPSNFWVETKEEKDKLLANYRRVLSRVDCRYFKFGTGICRFGNKCFYRHCDEFGEHIDAGAPTARRPRRDQSRNIEHLIRSQADEIDQIGVSANNNCVIL